MYTKENISKLDYYFNNLVKTCGREKYYINAMNNQSDHILGRLDDKRTLVRSEHNYCNWTFIAYSDLNKGFKQYEDRRWFYITKSDSPEYLQIRRDLVQEWSAKNAKDTVLVVVPNGVVEIPMQNLFGACPISFKYEWNSEGNVVYRFDISRLSVIGDESYQASEETVNWFSKSCQYIGNCNYAKHRTSNKQLIMASYNNDGSLKNYHKIKSIRQFYDLFDVEHALNICYKTFQRLINKNMVGYFFEISGHKVWLKVEDPASNAIPETWGNETVEVSESMVEAISVNVKNVQEIETVIENTVNTVQEYIPEIIKSNTDPKLGKPKRVIVKVENEHNEVSDEKWIELIQGLDKKPKRIIIRP